jgi:exodeoxyribonuclease-3
VAPGDLDSWSPDGLRGTIFHTTEERAAMDRIVGTGLVDLYRAKNPDGTMFSWWDYRAGCFHKNQGLRIDLLLATPPVLRAAREVWIDRDYRKKKDGDIPSDHAPVIADL